MGRKDRAAAEPLLTVESRDEGRNARVHVWPDRIERVRARSFGSLSRSPQDTEVTPMHAVSSVQTERKGFRTIVRVHATGNSIDFRVPHDDAVRFKELVTRLSLESHAPGTAIPKSAVDQVRELAELRDQGLMSPDEFEQKRRELLEL